MDRNDWREGPVRQKLVNQAHAGSALKWGRIHCAAYEAVGKIVGGGRGIASVAVDATGINRRVGGGIERGEIKHVVRSCRVSVVYLELEVIGELPFKAGRQSVVSSTAARAIERTCFHVDVFGHQHRTEERIDERSPGRVVGRLVKVRLQRALGVEGSLTDVYVLERDSGT